MSDYNLLIHIWVIGSIPFIMSNIVVAYVLLVKRRVLLGVVEVDLLKVKDSLESVDMNARMLPLWLVAVVLTVIMLTLSILDGLLWAIKPYKQLKKFYNVVFWNFKEIK